MPTVRPRRSGRRAEATDPASLPRRQLAGTFVLAAIVSLAFLTGLFIFHQRARDYLDDAMGVRLQSIASTAAAAVPGDSLLVWWLQPQTPVGVVLLDRGLGRVETDNDLSRIVVYQVDKTVLLDTSHVLRAGDTDPFLALDLAAVEQARSGIASYSRLQRVGETYLKAGYSPVFDSYGEVAGFVGVMASPGFFGALRALRGTLAAVGTAVVGVVLLFTFAYLGYARRLARARHQLQRSETLSAMGRMAAGIAHEIRNPLGIIKNTAQLMREELEDAGQSTALLQYIPDEVDRLNETLTGYLEFARDAPPRMERADLGKVLRRTLKLLVRDFETAQVEVVDNLDEVGQLELMMDPRRMQQVFLNLFLNAVQAMPDGGRIELRAEAWQRGARVTVEDSGTGIDPARAESLFEPFFTSKEKGSGLGLSMVRRIVEEHGGTIRLEPGSLRGARAVLELPGRALGPS